MRTRYLAAAAVAAAALVAGAAPAALAGTPSPSPSPTVTTPAPTPSTTPTPRPLFRFQPQRFVVQSSTGNPAGSVFANGPIRGVGTGNFDAPAVWSLAGPVGSVRLLRTPLGAPVVDPGSCTASLVQTGRWVLLGRSGADVRAFGFGTYTATEYEVLPRLFGRCLVHARPLWRGVQVLGVGRALQLRLHQLAPRVGPALEPVS